VVAVDWIAPKSNKRRFGQCTRYLVGLKPNDVVTVSVKPSVMKLPPLDSSPVVMAGLGTGMAPFRAFIQERAVRKREGHAVGARSTSTAKSSRPTIRYYLFNNCTCIYYYYFFSRMLDRTVC